MDVAAAAAGAAAAATAATAMGTSALACSVGELVEEAVVRATVQVRVADVGVAWLGWAAAGARVGEGSLWPSTRSR